MSAPSSASHTKTLISHNTIAQSPSPSTTSAQPARSRDLKKLNFAYFSENNAVSSSTASDNVEGFEAFTKSFFYFSKNRINGLIKDKKTAQKYNEFLFLMLVARYAPAKLNEFQFARKSASCTGEFTQALNSLHKFLLKQNEVTRSSLVQSFIKKTEKMLLTTAPSLLSLLKPLSFDFSENYGGISFVYALIKDYPYLIDTLLPHMLTTPTSFRHFSRAVQQATNLDGMVDEDASHSALFRAYPTVKPVEIGGKPEFKKILSVCDISIRLHYFIRNSHKLSHINTRERFKHFLETLAGNVEEYKYLYLNSTIGSEFFSFEYSTPLREALGAHPPFWPQTREAQKIPLEQRTQLKLFELQLDAHMEELIQIKEKDTEVCLHPMVEEVLRVLKKEVPKELRKKQTQYQYESFNFKSAHTGPASVGPQVKDYEQKENEYL